MLVCITTVIDANFVIQSPGDCSVAGSAGRTTKVFKMSLDTAQPFAQLRNVAGQPFVHAEHLPVRAAIAPHYPSACINGDPQRIKTVRRYTPHGDGATVLATVPSVAALIDAAGNRSHRSARSILSCNRLKIVAPSLYSASLTAS